MSGNEFHRFQNRVDELESRLDKVHDFSACLDKIVFSNDGARIENLQNFVQINRKLEEVGSEKENLVSLTIPEVSAAIKESESRLEQIRASETFDAERFAEETANLARLLTDEKKTSLKLRLIEENIARLKSSKARHLDELYRLQGESSVLTKIEGLLYKFGIKGSEFSFKRKWTEDDCDSHSCDSNEEENRSWDRDGGLPPAKRFRLNLSDENEFPTLTPSSVDRRNSSVEREDPTQMSRSEDSASPIVDDLTDENVSNDQETDSDKELQAQISNSAARRSNKNQVEDKSSEIDENPGQIQSSSREHLKSSVPGKSQASTQPEVLRSFMFSDPKVSVQMEVSAQPGFEKPLIVPDNSQASTQPNLATCFMSSDPKVPVLTEVSAQLELPFMFSDPIVPVRTEVSAQPEVSRPFMFSDPIAPVQTEATAQPEVARPFMFSDPIAPVRTKVSAQKEFARPLMFSDPIIPVQTEATAQPEVARPFMFSDPIVPVLMEVSVQKEFSRPFMFSDPIIPVQTEVSAQPEVLRPFMFSDPIVPVQTEVSAQPEVARPFMFSDPIGLDPELRQINSVSDSPASKVSVWRKDDAVTVDKSSTVDENSSIDLESPSTGVAAHQSPVIENPVSSFSFLKPATIFNSGSQAICVPFDSSNTIKCFKNSHDVIKPKQPPILVDLVTRSVRAPLPSKPAKKLTSRPIKVPLASSKKKNSADIIEPATVFSSSSQPIQVSLASSKNRNYGDVIKPAAIISSSSQPIQVSLASSSKKNSDDVIKPAAIIRSGSEPVESSNSFSFKDYGDVTKPATIFNSNFLPIRVRVDYSDKENYFEDCDNVISQAQTPTPEETSWHHESDDPSRPESDDAIRPTAAPRQEEEGEIYSDEVDDDDEEVAQRTVMVVLNEPSEAYSADYSGHYSPDDYASDFLGRRYHGSVVKLNQSYGFIRPRRCCWNETPNKFIFFHRKSLFDPRDWKYLGLGIGVDFEIEKDSGRSRFKANDVRIAGNVIWH